MLLIKPYGRSETERDSKNKLRRKVRRNPGTKALVEIAEFTKNYPQLVIAQWISMIDKIAIKPKGGRKPTPGQWELREKLGRASFEILDSKGLFSTNDKEELKHLWWSKIHPYFSTEALGISASVDIWRSETHPCESKIKPYLDLEKPSKNKKDKPNLKGHWYECFDDDDKEPANISEEDAKAIAEKIYEHLYEKEYRKGPDRPNKNKGLITARAESIAKNVTTLLGREHPWSEKDEKDYKQAGDIAKQILTKAKEKMQGKFFLRDAARILHEQYGRLFKGNDGKPLPISKARDRFPGLFALHSAIKDTYTRILKHSKKGRYNKKDVACILPKNMDDLLQLVKRKRDNRDLNALIRLGKVICYQADSVANIDTNWPEAKDLQKSRYLTSDGQAKIKRNEAFVRVWRYTIALGARTLKDWADPYNRINRDKDDILMNDILMNIQKVTDGNFCEADYQKKLPLLFGNHNQHGFFEGDKGLKNLVLKLALGNWSNLRNAAFHFKGLDSFKQALTANLSGFPAAAVDTTRKLLEKDLDDHHEQLIKNLRAAHVEEYYSQDKLDVLIKAIVDADTPLSPLPRFNRVLARAENAWRKSQSLHLPPPGKRDKLEKHPGQRCRYVTAKALYERPFRAWLEKRTAQELNEWIKCAVKRTTQDARKLNKDEFAVAKAAEQIDLTENQGISDFIDQLAARTATELRVQRGYNSDPDKARAQTKYLDDLRCDVVAQAFKTYLDDSDLRWVTTELKDKLPEDKHGSLDKAPKKVPEKTEEIEDWQAVLYFLIHLVPVDAIAQLRHQLRKWLVLKLKQESSNNDEVVKVKSLAWLFDLYCDMHDAKFEGQETAIVYESDLKDLFESEDLFHRACPEPGTDTNQLIPWRGLREILRFGDLKPLMPIFRKYPITAENIDKLNESEKTIAAQQKKREDLHKKWEKEKKLSPKDKEDYRNALKDVEKHRHLAAHVRLNNHVRLHRLMMRVLGRLVDYAGLWERDLFFITLALINLLGKQPNEVFDDKYKKKGVEYLKNGQIVEAVRKLRKSQNEDAKDAKEIFERLKQVFGEHFLDGRRKDYPISIRNNLAHFNMLQSNGNKPPNLTEAVNDTRKLMAYDRKLKNAVSQSVKEMLMREGLDLSWDMENHQLTRAKVKTRKALHLGNKNLRNKIEEDLHGKEYVKMVADLFGGKVQSPNKSSEQRNQSRGKTKRRQKRKYQN